MEKSKLERVAKSAPIVKVVLSREFFEIYLITVCQIYYGYYIINTFKSIGAIHISDDKFLTLIGSVGALCNGVFRIFWSTLLDYYPFRRVNSALLLIQLVSILTI